MSEPTVEPIPCLRDNYAYLVRRPEADEAVIVDAAEAAPVAAALDSRGLRLAAILHTHHHWDHTGGDDELLARWPGAVVVGHASDGVRVPRQSRPVVHGDRLEVGGLSGRVLHTPGHTRGGVTYVFGGQAFTGDTLFQAGCGRLLEGTAAEMWHSLATVLAGSLPPEARIWCGHEYTSSSLRFAVHAEPDNAAARRRLTWADERTEAGLPTVPSTLAEELTFNPFLRAGSVERFAELRRAKDRF